MALIGFNIIFTAVYFETKLNFTQELVGTYVGGSGDPTAGLFPDLTLVYNISDLIAFVSLWTTTGILMKSYRDKSIRSVAYWIILIMPLGFFLTTYFYDYFVSPLLISYFHKDPISLSVYETGYLSLGKPIGGLLFAIAFWNMSKLVGYERNMKISIVIAGWGIFFVFSANQAITQIVSPYPPFGISSVTIMNVASYLLVLGIFNSATLVSANNDLRTSIHKHATKLLRPIGRAEMEREIEKAVTKISEEKEVANISDEVPFEFDENELKDYLKEVISTKKAHASQ